MADLLTAYDDEESNVFIDCKVCSKKIRGDTNYKIHRTTLQHLKREEALAAKVYWTPPKDFHDCESCGSIRLLQKDSGRIPTPPALPEWTDIKQYLKYLNLDEPIIGLSSLVQEEDFVSDDGKVLLKYKCKLCSVEMDMCSMATHVVGRRHRQKYLEWKRPELVTWNKNSLKQPGLVAKAKAAVVEKQEGWGSPVPLNKSESRGKRRAADRYQASARRRASPGRGRKEYSAPSEDVYGPLYMKDNIHGGLSYHQNDLYDKFYKDSLTYRDAMPFSQDDRQRSFCRGDQIEQFYMREDGDIRSLTDDSNGRGYFDEALQRSHDKHQNEYSTERNSSRGWRASRDEYDDIYQGSSASALHPGERDYHEQMREPMYTTRQGNGSSLDEMQLHDRNYKFTEKEREHFQDVRRAKAGSYQAQGRRQNYMSTEDVPAKKQRTSRPSDVAPIETAVPWKSQIDAEILKSNQKSATRTQVFGTEEDLGVRHVTPQMENVLDVLNDIQIENVEEANFLKEKLCNLFKEFQSNKAQRGQQSQASHTAAGYTDYGHMSDPHMNKLRDALQSRHLDDQGFKESGRSDREFRESRYEEQHRRISDTRRNEKGVLHESVKYERVSRSLGDQPREFEADLREYLNTRHTDPRSSKHKVNQEARHYEDYERIIDPRYHIEASRGQAEKGYSDPNFDIQQEYYRDVKRGGTAEHLDDHMPHQDGERGYQESHWNPRSREEEMYAEEPRQHLADYHSGQDLYDPYHPSSPPRGVKHSATLDKLASTLLELVARKTS